MKPKVVVVGLGYVGFPLALALTRVKKFSVFGFDIDQKKVEAINRGEFGDLRATGKESILSSAKYIIVCVPTPVDAKLNPDLEPLKKAARSIARSLKKGQVIVIESTVNPGVCENVILPILETSGLKGGTDFDLGHCPERINPGDSKWNVTNIPRNVGALTNKGAEKIVDFYRSFLEAPVNIMKNIKEAEATKILENCFRDVNIAFINEMACSFDRLGIDIINVIKGSSSKPFAFLPHYPGCGVGGHCIPVDPYYLIGAARNIGFNHELLKLSRKINRSMPQYTVKLLEEQLGKLGKKISGAKIGLLGLSYKGGVGDLRESPALEIKRILEEKGADLHTFDPYLKELSSAKSLFDLLNQVEAIIIATDHTDFKKISPKELKKMGVKVVIDGRNCLNKSSFAESKILYKGIGS